MVSAKSCSKKSSILFKSLLLLGLVTLAIVIPCASARLESSKSSKNKNKQVTSGRGGISRDLNLDELFSDEKDSHSNKNKAELEKKVDSVNEKFGKDKNSTSTISSLVSWIKPRYIEQLTNHFNGLGVSTTVIAGIAAVVLLPVFLVLAVLRLITPVNSIINAPHKDDDADYGKMISSFYKAPAPESYYGAPSTTYGGYAPAPMPMPTPKPVYGGYASPAPSPVYGGYSAPAPVPSPTYGGYQPAPAPAPAPVPVPQPQYGYPENPVPLPAPVPAPSPQYGGYSQPAPSSSYSHSYSHSAPSPSSNYEQPSPSVVSMSTSYAYPGALVSAPAPSTHYGKPPSTSYGVDSLKISSKDSSTSASSKSRKTRSLVKKYNDSQCVERLACEVSKATKSIQLPNWMNKVADALPSWTNNNLVRESRKLLNHSNNCSRFQCDSYDAWKH